MQEESSKWEGLPQATLEALEPRLMLDGTTGDGYLSVGSLGYASLADGSVTDLDYANDFSIETIINIDAYKEAGSWPGILAKGPFNVLYTNGAGWGLGVRGQPSSWAGQRLVASVGDGTNGASVQSPYFVGVVHAVMTWDVSEGTVELIINNDEGDDVGDDIGWSGTATNTSITGTDIENADNLQIGKAYKTLNEDIFMVRMWNRKLSATEITDLWGAWDNNGSDQLPGGFSTTSLVSEWLMDEESDSGGGAGTGYLLDTAGSNYLQLQSGADLVEGTGSLALAGPGDAATDVEKSVYLKADGGWDTLGGTDVAPLQYYFQVAEDSSFTTGLIESGWVSHYGHWQPNLDPSTTYYYRAKVKDDDGTTSSYTSYRTFTTEAAETWYVRPAGGSYGSEDGSSYANAWDGLDNIVWGIDGVEPGDTLYISGTFLRASGSGDSTGHEIQGRGTSDNPITIRMDSPSEDGVLWGVSQLTGITWSDDGGGVYSTTSSINTGYGVFEDVSDLTHTLLLKGDSTAPDAGEWYLDGGTFYIHLTDGSDPTGAVYARTSDSYTGFAVRRIEYIEFKNSRFWSIRFNPGSSDNDLYGVDAPARANHVTFDGTSLRYVTTGLVTYLYDDHDYWTFEGVEFMHAGSGVYTNSGARASQGAAYLTIRNSTFKYIATPTFPHGSADGHAIGIQGGHDFLIEKNYFEDVGTGITFYGYSWQTIRNNIVRWNFFNDVNNVGGGHGRAIETGGSSGASDCSGNLWYGNIIMNVTGDPGSEGIGFRVTIPSLNGNDNTIMVFNNLVYDAQHSYYGYTGTPGADSEFYNNIFLNPTDNFLYYVWAEALQGADNNLYYPDADTGTRFDYHLGGSWTYGDFYDWQSDSGFEANSLISDPKLTDISTPTEASDFYPLWDSPVIDAGDDTAGHYQTTDFDGNPIYGQPDIGPFEYQPPNTMGTDDPKVAKQVRVYGDGKFRYLEEDSGAAADLTVEPNAGWGSYSAAEQRPFWADVEADTWSTSGTYYRKWIVDDGANDWSDYATDHTVGGLVASTAYNVKVGGVFQNTYTSDGSGDLQFTYTGSNYNALAFELEEAPSGPTVTITATDASAAEEASDTGNFRVSRGSETSGDLAVDYSVSGTAVSGDYSETLGGTVTITDGNTYADIVITPVDDGEPEGNETVILTLQSGTAYVVGSPDNDTVTIADNDQAVTVTLTATDASAAETSSDTGTFQVSRGAATSGDLTVNYTVSGTASGGDYTETLGGTVTITDGNTSADITITPVDDTKLEDDQTVILTLSSGGGYTIGSPSSDTVTIADNDSITDNFESGNGTGGSGWGGNWALSGDAEVTDAGTPRNSYHLRLRRGTGVATRAADLSESTDAHLTFYWKADSFEGSEYATVEIFDGTQWQEVLRVEDGDDDNAYHYADIDLSIYTLTADFEVRITANMGQPNDRFYIDDIVIQ